MLGIRDRLRDRRSRSASRNTDSSSPLVIETMPIKHEEEDEEPQVLSSPPRPVFGTPWVEPSLADKPSYSDHGGTAHGVMEHMQPLGQTPNAKVRARVRSEGVRRSFGRRRSGMRGLNDSQDTPEVSPAPSSPVLDSEESAEPSPVPDDDDGRDEDFAPRVYRRRMPPATPPSRREMKHRRKTVTPPPQLQPPKELNAVKSPEDVNGHDPFSPQKLKEIVEHSKERAIEAGKPDLALAVNEIFEQSLGNPLLMALLRAIVAKEASKEQTKEFQRYVKAAKKKLNAAKNSSADLHTKHSHALSSKPEQLSRHDLLSRREPLTTLRWPKKFSREDSSRPSSSPFNHHSSSITATPNHHNNHRSHLSISLKPPLSSSSSSSSSNHLHRQSRLSAADEMAPRTRRRAAAELAAAAAPADDDDTIAVATAPSAAALATADRITAAPATVTDARVTADPATTVSTTATKITTAPTMAPPSAPASKTKSPSKKRTGSVGSDSSLTSMTSNEDNTEGAKRDKATNGESEPSTIKVAITKGKQKATNGTDTAPAKTHGVKRSYFQGEIGEIEEIDDFSILPPPPSKRPKLTVTTSKQAGKKGTKQAPSKATNGKDIVPAAEQRGVKRTATEELEAEEYYELSSDTTERDRAFEAKIQKLSEDVVREMIHPESSVRTAISGPHAGTRAASKHTRFTGGTPLSSTVPSRAASPGTSKGKGKQPATRKAKMKQSPEKKKNTSGQNGLRAGGAATEGPIGGEDNGEVSDNHDYCTACGGGGHLLCCDGCERCFHFCCLDPPVKEDDELLQQPWFCYHCQPRTHDAAEHPKPARGGLFGQLLDNLDKTNPSNFSLPGEVRDYYEGVTAAKDGSFAEVVKSKPAKNPAGYHELPNYTKIKDSKGNTRMCFRCMKSTQGSRPMLKCDFCPENWHLDCIDPPLVIPPSRNFDGSKIRDWMCPLHADHDLREMYTRKIYARKPKNPKRVMASLKRGFQNGGIIEIFDDESSDDSASEFYDESRDGQDVVYTLPASGIKMDFLAKAKQHRIQQLRDEHVHKKARYACRAPSQLMEANFACRALPEQQVALNLAQLASGGQNLGLGTDEIENLVGALIAEAPPDVVAIIMNAESVGGTLSSSSAIPPSPPTSEQPDALSAGQRKQLEMLQELIRRRLEGSKG